MEQLALDGQLLDKKKKQKLSDKDLESLKQIDKILFNVRMLNSHLVRVK